MKQVIMLTTVIALTLVCRLATADAISDSYTKGDTLTAEKMNNIKKAVNDNYSRIEALESELIKLKSTVASQEATISSLVADLSVVQANSVLALDGILVYTVDTNGYALAQFTGVNVQVINGENQETLNGLGNIIVGYNQAREGSGPPVCSDGQYADQTDCENAGMIWAQSHKSGSHNLVGGNKNSYSQHSGIVFGLANVINRDYSSVTGGIYNVASGIESSVSGGHTNTASGNYSSVSGGAYNTASGSGSSVSGGGLYDGSGNTASENYSSISGGTNNTASGISSSILGGTGQNATTTNETIPALP